MLLPADLFLALRYLRPKRTFVSIVTLLSVLGPILGVAVLLIVSAIMTGFDRDIRKAIMDMQAHLQVYPLLRSTFSEPEKLAEKLRENGIAASPVIEGQTMMQMQNSILPKVIRGIDPKTEHTISNVKSSVKYGHYEIKEGEALIGLRLANQLRLKPGDKFLLHSPARLTKHVKWKEDGSVEVTKPDEVYLPEEVAVAGIYSVGVADFDENIIFLHIDQAADLYGYKWDTATSIMCRVPKPLEIEPYKEIAQGIAQNIEVQTWQERNQMLFGTLKVEKNLMTFLMAFIVLVASFSIAGTLITVVVQKTREIGVMKAVGFGRMMIARVFLFQGAIIGVIGTFLGTCLGLLVITFRKQIAAVLSFIMGHDVFPAELYHLEAIPAQVTAGDLTFIVILSLLICVSAAVVPAIYASSLQPAKALQEDN